MHEIEPQDLFPDIAAGLERNLDPLIRKEPQLGQVVDGIYTLSDFAHMAVCHRCGCLAGGRAGRGDHISLLQTCRCEPHCEERWPGFDFNIAVELCYCCGQVLLNSGSRWSVWFCRDCKTLVGRLNGRVKRYAIPIGRHSFHGGFKLDGDSTPLDIEAFTATWASVTQAMRAVDAWSGAVVRSIIAERWPPGDRDVGLLEYLRRCGSATEEKERRFAAMLEFLNGWQDPKQEP
jgi:hypothetical protein